MRYGFVTVDLIFIFLPSTLWHFDGKCIDRNGNYRVLIFLVIMLGPANLASMSTACVQCATQADGLLTHVVLIIMCAFLLFIWQGPLKLVMRSNQQLPPGCTPDPEQYAVGLFNRATGKLTLIPVQNRRMGRLEAEIEGEWMGGMHCNAAQCNCLCAFLHVCRHACPDGCCWVRELQ